MQVVFGHKDQLIRDKLLLDPRITLKKATDICLDAEASKIRKRTIDSSCAVNTVASVPNYCTITDSQSIANIVVNNMFVGSVLHMEKYAKNVANKIILQTFVDHERQRKCVKLKPTVIDQVTNNFSRLAPFPHLL